LCVLNLCALFAKLVRGELGEMVASVCHERELDAKREVGERLELVVAGWYDLLALFPPSQRSVASSPIRTTTGTLSPSWTRTCSTSRV
jgi:hypothetical protein